MDYKEVRTRSKILIFCNFDDLLTESYEVKSMAEVNQVAKTTSSGGDYICHCPFCKQEGHTKHKLYVKTDLTVGHCFVCCREFINVTDKVEVSYKIPNAFLNFLGMNEEFKLRSLPQSSENPSDFTLDKFMYEFEDYDDTGINYLKGRHGFMKDLYKALGFKFWDGNVVMPFKTPDDELFYYQIRFSSKKSKIRYYFPPIEGKPVYGIWRKLETPRIIICEGVFDAIACMIMAPEFIPIAVLGSSISDYQLDYIRHYIPIINEIKVYMDDTEKSKGIANKVKTVIDYCPISIIPSDGTDPEEYMNKLLRRGYSIDRLQWIKPKPVKENIMTDMIKFNPFI